MVSLHRFPAEPGLAHGFSTTALGSVGLTHAPDPAPVLASRRAFARALGLDSETLTTAGAVHGSTVVRVDEQRDVFRQTFVGTVLTPLARQGIFRFFPGADNQSAIQNNPTVDRNGNPMKPANATGDLQSFNVFQKSDGTARDPNRPGFDPSGFIQNTLLSAMPMPNDYTVGDGLNTAGIRFTRHISGLDFPDGQGYDTNRDQINWRLDHSFSSRHKLSVNYTWERGKNNTVQSGIMNWPGGYNGSNQKWPLTSYLERALWLDAWEVLTRQGAARKPQKI